MPAKPTIDDQFWFDQSRDAIAQASVRRNEAASKLATLLGWLWGIYTASISIGVTFSQKFEFPPPTLAILVTPIPLLLIAYWCAIWAQIPSLIEFDPRSPTEIQVAFSHGLNSRSSRLNIALWLTLLSTCVVAAAIVVGSITRPVGAPYLKAMQYKSASGVTLSITGRFPPDTMVHIRYLPLLSGGWNKVKEQGVLSTSEGTLQIVIPLDADGNSYEVLADWEQEGSRRGITAVAAGVKSPTTQPPAVTPR